MARRDVAGSVRRWLMAAVVLVMVAVPVLQPRPAEAHTVLDVGAYQQYYNLSCEFAALQIVTSYWGDAISEHWSASVTNWSDNPHHGFRGDITGWWGNTWDYGIYNEPLAEIARWAGYGADARYADASTLAAYHDDGIPVIVWLSTELDPGWYEVDEYGEQYKIVPYMHVVVAYGHDDTGVYIADPATGWYDHYSWDYFKAAWSILDNMMLAVYPV